MKGFWPKYICLMVLNLNIQSNYILWHNETLSITFMLIHHSMFGNNCRYLLSRTDRTRRGFLLALSKIDPALQVSADTARKPDSHKGTNKDMYQNG